MTTPIGPYPPHARFSFQGVYGSAADPYEAWTFRLNTGPGGNGAPLGGKAQTCINAWQTHLAGVFGPHVRLTSVKAAPIGTDGRYVGDSVEVFTAAAGIPGTGPVSPVYPTQVALAASLRTPARGPGGRGRVYLPTTISSVGPNDGLISPTDAQNVAQRLGLLIDAMNADLTTGRVCVVSIKGTRHEVSSVRVGRALDTMRSRRRSIEEAYGADVALA